MSAVPSSLRIYLKEQDPAGLAEAARISDNWASAHNAYPKSTEPSDSRLGAGSSVSSRSSLKPNHNYPSFTRDMTRVKCHACGEFGHIRSTCPKNPASFTRRVQVCLDKPSQPNSYTVCGTVNGSPVSTIIRDSGCSCVIVSDHVLPDSNQSNSGTRVVADYLGREDIFPVVKCFIRCPYFNGWVDAVRAPIKFCSVLIGNVPGATDLSSPNSARDDPEGVQSLTGTEDLVQAVTRATSRAQPIHPLVVPDIDPIDIDHGEFKLLQQTCPSLARVRLSADNGSEVVMRDGSIYQYIIKNSLLYRQCKSARIKRLVGKLPLVLPEACRSKVLKTAHECPLAGHFGHRKTAMRIKENFFWPSVTSDVRNFCRSCDKCQRLSPKGALKRVPMEPMPIITEPFSRVAIDLVGPLAPPSVNGERYILTLIDYATGFPEALPLKEITSIAVAEALLVIFSRVGIPREILSDRGTQFTSQLMGELHGLLGLKPLFTSPYHAMSNGRVERMHATLKSCLRKLCEDKPRDWPRYLVPTMFALREIPSDRTGYSAFELLYGREVRGPLMVLRDLWENNELSSDDRSAFQYVVELQEKLGECAKLAAQTSELSALKYKTYFDLKSQLRQFSVGDEVLILLPDNANKLLMGWKGPFKVLERRSRVNYIIDVNGNPKLYHANLLKRYYRRATVRAANIPDALSCHEIPMSSDPFTVCQNSVITNCDTDTNCDEIVTVEGGDEQVSVCPDLSQEQVFQVEELLEEFKNTLSPLPGCTDVIKFDIELTTTTPVRARFYPVPVHLQPHFNAEVDKLLALGIIQPSTSPFSSPVVMVAKPDSSYRMTVDYRALNSITKFQAEPPCLVDEDLHKFTNCSYFSEIDLAKAYYQIMLTDRAKPLTAFPTYRGLMEFNRLPFGAVNACSGYASMMRIVLRGLPNVAFYFDNIFVYSESWQTHLIALRNVFHRLREYGLTARPSKCRIGFPTINYLGFVLGHNKLSMQEEKITAILEAKLPTTKKALRSFIGLVSFYRKFIPNVAAITSPISDMLKKGCKEPLVWSNDAAKCFQTLKTAISDKPVLKLPDLSKPFVLRTDASGLGLGAVLLQYVDNIPHPIAFASRKLLDRETRYSTIERECLGIVWGVLKFKFYLLGKSFYLEVDHKPLVYLNKFKGDNSRIMRWALALQSYHYTILHVPGRDNLGADFLSRAVA